MSHAVYTRNLGRSRSWRKATVRSLTQALLTHERIETTLAKAKETQRFVERLITLGKKGSLSDRRQAIRLLDNSALVHRLFSEVAPRFAKRPGGYTRVFHNGTRPGDGASMAVIELVELSPDKPRVSPDKPVKKSPEEPAAATPEIKQQKPEKPQGFLERLRKFFKDRPKP